jgi:hypothetical protein
MSTLGSRSVAARRVQHDRGSGQKSSATRSRSVAHASSLVRINGQELKTFVVRVADHGEVSKTAVPSNDGFPLCLLLMRNTSR